MMDCKTKTERARDVLLTHTWKKAGHPAGADTGSSTVKMARLAGVSASLIEKVKHELRGGFLCPHCKKDTRETPSP